MRMLVIVYQHVASWRMNVMKFFRGREDKPSQSDVRSAATELPHEVRLWFRSLLGSWSQPDTQFDSYIAILLSIYRHGHFLDDRAFLETLNLVSLEVECLTAQVERMRSFFDALNERLRFAPSSDVIVPQSHLQQIGYVRIALRSVLREFASGRGEQHESYIIAAHELLKLSGASVPDFRHIVDCAVMDLRIVTSDWLAGHGYASHMDYFMRRLERRLFS
jgi:hypothetical protein